MTIQDFYQDAAECFMLNFSKFETYSVFGQTFERQSKLDYAMKLVSNLSNKSADLSQTQAELAIVLNGIANNVNYVAYSLAFLHKENRNCGESETLEIANKIEKAFTKQEALDLLNILKKKLYPLFAHISEMSLNLQTKRMLEQFTLS